RSARLGRPARGERAEPAPQAVRHVPIEEVAQQAKETAGAQSAEQVPDEVAEGGAPGCGGAEEERRNDGNCVGGAKLDEPGDDGDADLERNQDGGVDRGDLGREDELARVPPDLKQPTLHARAILMSPPSTSTW